MKLAFTKMQGAGNDFVMVDATRAPIVLSPAQVRWLADRRFGVGFDQLLMVEPARSADTDFRYRIFNADGAEVEHCGNGARCFVRFVRDRGLTDRDRLRVEVARGVIFPQLEPDGTVSVDMGAPEFEPARIPFDAPARAVTYPLDVDGSVRTIGALSMGNPHAVQVVDDVDTAPVATEGPRIEAHPRFPLRVNAGFLQVVDRRTARLRVYERGAGETLACGTGACAAVVSGVLRGLFDADAPVAVHTRGGVLVIRWAGDGAAVWMRGPAETVFEGSVDLPDLQEPSGPPP
ncbi:MAG: diaminopimelate epimerase [Burkholderiales bacterium]|jgi:diaminopimelate epimerase|nr:diaminopimelate epimerase [Burkholderiales bacterium]